MKELLVERAWRTLDWGCRGIRRNISDLRRARVWRSEAGHRDVVPRGMKDESNVGRPRLPQQKRDKRRRHYILKGRRRCGIGMGHGQELPKLDGLHFGYRPPQLQIIPLRLSI